MNEVTKEAAVNAPGTDVTKPMIELLFELIT